MEKTPANATGTLICPRHKVQTPLSCVTCETPICPQCYVRTAVGLRCPVCAQGVTVKLKGARRWPVMAVGVVVLGLIAVLAVRAITSGDDGGSDDALAGGPPANADGAAAGYQVISRPDLGFSVEIPKTWQAAPDNSNTNVAYTEPRSSEGSLRVSVNQTPATVADVVERLTGELQRQGGTDFAQTPVQVSGLPGIKLDYRFPTSPNPGSTLASHSSYIVKKDATVYSFQLATTDPGGKGTVFGYIASKFTLL
jgi:hypothetical protein